MSTITSFSNLKILFFRHIPSSILKSKTIAIMSHIKQPGLIVFGCIICLMFMSCHSLKYRNFIKIFPMVMKSHLQSVVLFDIRNISWLENPQNPRNEFSILFTAHPSFTLIYKALYIDQNYFITFYPLWSSHF